MLHVVVVTAEPYGAYHLAPLRQEVFGSAAMDLRHWLPGPGASQRPGWVPTDRSADLLDRADVLLVTGGGLTPWTAAASQLGHARGLPVCFVEMAWPSPRTPFRVPVAAAGAGSSATADIVRQLCGIAPVVVGRAVTGRPGARGDKCLLLPVVSSETPDGQSGLRRAAVALRAAGWDVVVQIHPREPVGIWDDVARDVTERRGDVIDDGVGVAVGTSTTRMLDMVASGVPVLRVACGRGDVDRHPLLAECGPLVAAEGVVAAAETARALSAPALERLIGAGDLSDGVVALLRAAYDVR